MLSGGSKKSIQNKLVKKTIMVCFIFSYILSQHFYPAGDYMFKVNFRNTRAICEICSKLKIKTSKWCALFWCLYCYFWTYFTYCSSVSIVDFEQINAGWVTLLDSTKFFLAEVMHHKRKSNCNGRAPDHRMQVKFQINWRNGAFWKLLI